MSQQILNSFFFKLQSWIKLQTWIKLQMDWQLCWLRTEALVQLVLALQEVGLLKLKEQELNNADYIFLPTGTVTPIEQVPYIVSMQVSDDALNLFGERKTYLFLLEIWRSSLRWFHHRCYQNLNCSTLSLCMVRYRLGSNSTE